MNALIVIQLHGTLQTLDDAHLNFSEWKSIEFVENYFKFVLKIKITKNSLLQIL